MTNATNGTQPHSLGLAIEHLRARWGEIVAFGALLVVLGVAALCFTLPSTVATVTLNGVFFLVAGVAEIGVGAHAKSWARFFLWIIGGAIYLTAGVICIINPIFASLALTLALGAGLIVRPRFAPTSPFICRPATRAPWCCSPRQSPSCLAW